MFEAFIFVAVVVVVTAYAVVCCAAAAAVAWAATRLLDRWLFGQELDGIGSVEAYANGHR